MKLKPTVLFLGATIFLLLLGFFAGSKSLDINFHDTYFVISYQHLAILTAFLTGLTTLVYFGVEKLKRPIKSKTGFWHFGLFISALFMLFVAINTSTTSYYQAENSFTGNVYGPTAMLLVAFILFLASAIVSLYGMTKALLGKRE